MIPSGKLLSSGYGQTGDLEWYDPQQIATHDGALVITLDSTDTLQPHLTLGLHPFPFSIFPPLLTTSQVRLLHSLMPATTT
jgi:hypothetical protein